MNQEGQFYSSPDTPQEPQEKVAHPKQAKKRKKGIPSWILVFLLILCVAALVAIVYFSFWEPHFSPKGRADHFQEEAEQLYHNGLYDGAILMMDQALTLDKNSDRQLVYLRMLAAAGRTDEASVVADALAQDEHLNTENLAELSTLYRSIAESDLSSAYLQVQNQPALAENIDASTLADLLLQASTLFYGKDTQLNMDTYQMLLDQNLQQQLPESVLDPLIKVRIDVAISRQDLAWLETNYAAIYSSLESSQARGRDFIALSKDQDSGQAHDLALRFAKDLYKEQKLIPEATKLIYDDLQKNGTEAELKEFQKSVAQMGVMGGSAFRDLLGNSNGNLNNAGIVLAIDNQIYYAKGTYRQLHRQSPSGDESSVLDKGVDQLSYKDGRIYFVSIDDNRSLHSIKPDGSDEKVLYDKMVKDYVLVDQHIYLVDSNDRGIYAVSLQDHQVKRLGNYEAGEIASDGAMLYFSESGRNNGLSRIDFDGGQYQTLSESHVTSINPVAGRIYYLNMDEGSMIFRMDRDGQNNVLVYDQPNITQLNVSETAELNKEDIYFVTNNSIYAIKADTNSANVIYEGQVADINLIGNRVYFWNDDIEWWRIDYVEQDGSGTGTLG